MRESGFEAREWSSRFCALIHSTMTQGKCGAGEAPCVPLTFGNFCTYRCPVIDHLWEGGGRLCLQDWVFSTPLSRGLASTPAGWGWLLGRLFVLSRLPVCCVPRSQRYPCMFHIKGLCLPYQCLWGCFCAKPQGPHRWSPHSPLFMSVFVPELDHSLEFHWEPLFRRYTHSCGFNGHAYAGSKICISSPRFSPELQTSESTSRGTLQNIPS